MLRKQEEEAGLWEAPLASGHTDLVFTRWGYLETCHGLPRPFLPRRELPSRVKTDRARSLMNGEAPGCRKPPAQPLWAEQGLGVVGSRQARGAAVSRSPRDRQPFHGVLWAGGYRQSAPCQAEPLCPSARHELLLLGVGVTKGSSRSRGGGAALSRALLDFERRVSLGAGRLPPCWLSAVEHRCSFSRGGRGREAPAVPH